MTAIRSAISTAVRRAMRLPASAGFADGPWPVLNLDMVNSDTLDNRVTFSRGSGGGAFGSDGLYRWYGYNGLTWSTDLTNAVYSSLTTGTALTTSTETAPVVGGTPVFVREDTSTGNHLRGTSNSGASISGDGVRTASAYFKAAGRTRIRIESATNVSGASGARGVFELTGAGTVVTTSAIGTPVATGISGTITSVGNGWYRCALTYTPGTVGNTGSSISFALVDTGTNTSYTGDGASGVLFAAPQLELGSTASSYSPTTTAASGAPRFDYDPATPAGVTGGELVTNGDFSNGSTGWTVGAEWAITNGTAVLTGTGTASVLSYPSILTIGKTYQITWTVLSVSGSICIQNNAGTIVQQTNTAGTFQTYYVADATTFGGFKRVAGSVNAVIDNVSIKEVTFTPRGLLVEEQRTNLLTYSQDIANAAYISSVNATRTSNYAVAPDGTSTAGRLQITVANGALKQGAGVINTDYIQSIWVKSATGSPVQYQFWEGNGYNTTVTGTATSSWVRVSARMKDSASPRIDFGSNTLNADLLVWGAQLELGSFPTSYIPTTTASATRSADSASMTGANFSSWYSQTQGTFVVEYQSARTGSAIGVISANDGAGNNAFDLRNHTNLSYGIVGGVSQWTIPAGTPSTTAVNKSAIAYATNDAAAVLNGGAAGTDTLCTIPTVNQLSIGHLNAVTSFSLNGHIRRIQYYPTRLPNATLKALTTA